MEFNTNQKRVIECEKSPLLVEAGPGSGKTTVIVERIKYLINNLNVQPESFLVITFTRKAAENLKNKLKNDFSNEIIDKMQISTIHSFCLEYLKTKDEFLNLLDDDNSEKKALFIQKFKDQLGFTNENTVYDYQISSVINKFGEYTCFNVDSDKLQEYIEKTRPISKDYLDFVKEIGHFSKKLVDDNDFKDDWYNARYLQIAKAYPIYLNLLEEHDYVDYDTLQLKTLQYLKKDPETPYNAILIDEFQDTDPLQFRIFNILRKNCDYFTAVGDVDQHIYAFRSSYTDYFKEMSENYSPELISLNVNYRSTKDIVKITDSFIQDYRSEYSQKELESANEEYNNPSFLIQNETAEDEANNIFKIIQYLVNNKNLKYDDIAVLYRKHYNKTIPALIELFNQNNIDFTIRGQSDLKECDEVKSILILLWYITRRTDKSYISSADELKDLNFKGFCGETFEPTFWSLEDETKQYLTELQESYHDELLKVENEIRESEGRKKVKAVHNIKKNEELDILIEIFNKVEKPVVDLSKINSENDRQFFQDLNDLREESESEEPPTILDVYYKLISRGNYFTNWNENIIELNNLAVLTQTIHNYESFISNTDVKGLYFFLSRAISDYSSYYENAGGVQLMTVHAAKGLEFPVAIVSTLEKNKFPMAVKDPNREKNYINGSETFYTPNRCLKYKDLLIEDFDQLDDDEIDEICIEKENELDEAEEAHIIYVAMTRAADLLMLSCVGDLPEQFDKIKDELKVFNSEDDLAELTIKKHYEPPEEEKLKLNYSSYSTYKLCPFMYNLIYNFGFRVSDENVTNLGTVFHEIMEKINLKLKDNQEISDEELNNITNEVYGSMFDIEETQEEYGELKKAVEKYYENYSLDFEVLESELPFEIEKEEFILNGAIDLVYKINDNEIAILDYKNAYVTEDKLKKYIPQLYTYACALSELEDYKDYEIKKASVHFVKSDCTYEVEINENIINKQWDNLNNVALNIEYQEFPKIESHFCEYCKFKIICNGE